MKVILETIERRKFLKLEAKRAQIEEEMKLRKEKTGAYTSEGVLRDLQKQISKLNDEPSN